MRVRNVNHERWDYRMNERTIEQFERQIDSLLKEFGRHKSDNIQLRDKQASLLSESEDLKGRLNLAVSTIKKIVKRLKAIEREYEYR